MRLTFGRLLALVLLLVGQPAVTSATVIYTTYAGFYPANFFYLTDEDTVPPVSVETFDFSYGGALCPAPGTTNYLCARAHAHAGISQYGRIVLGAGARMKRTDVDAAHPQEHGVYANAHVDIYPIGGYVVGPAPGAYFVFGLHGTLSSSVSTAGVTVNAYSVANLYAGSGGGVQCFGTSCLPSSQQTIKVTNWNPTDGFSLDLRSDVKMFNPDALTGWDGEGIAEFYDTLELLSVQLVDGDDVPIPGVTLTYTDQNGQTVVIPDTPPDPNATVTPTPAVTATLAQPTPTPTAAPACASPPCEDCENCVDDDGDGFIDREDEDCAPHPADGSGVGIGDPASAKALDKCAKALRKVGAKLTSTTLTTLQSCLKAVGDCIQLKGGEIACLTKATTTCGKGRSALAGAATKLTAALTKPCGEPAVPASNLGLATGLGFDGETAACARRGVVSLVSVSDVAECVRRQHACGAERLIGFAVPRAGELLTFGGWDVASELPCLESASVGGGSAVEAAKQKALRKCDLVVQKASAKLVSGAPKSPKPAPLPSSRASRPNPATRIASRRPPPSAASRSTVSASSRRLSAPRSPRPAARRRWRSRISARPKASASARATTIARPSASPVSRPSMR
ncbi:MAG: hypothetical protein ABIR79_12195 [Candidatus Binatia bacterium]